MGIAVFRLLTLLCSSLAILAAPAPAADWVYFDLGEVILTGTTTTGYTFVPGVIENLSQLHQAGYQIGIISNTPEAWGANCQAKFTFLQNFITPLLKEPKPFPWTSFNNVVLPPFDRYRKPQPFMFLQGLAQACPGRALYISESQSELDGAKKLGYATYLKSSSPVSWPSATAIKRLLDEQFHFAYPSNCDLQPSIAASLLEQDRSSGVAACTTIP